MKKQAQRKMKQKEEVEVTDREGYKFIVTNISLAGENLLDYSSQSGQGKTDNPGLVTKVMAFKRGLKNLPYLLKKFTPTPQEVQLRKISTKMIMELGARVHAKTVRVNQEIKERNLRMGRTFYTDFPEWIATIFPVMAVAGEADNYYDGFIRNNIIAMKEYFDDLEAEYGATWFEKIVGAWKAEDELVARQMEYEMHAGHWGKCRGCAKCEVMKADIAEQMKVVKDLTQEFMELRKQ